MEVFQFSSFTCDLLDLGKISWQVSRLLGPVFEIIMPLGPSSLKFLLPAIVLTALTALLLIWKTSDTPAIWRHWLRPTAIYLAGAFGIWALYLFQYIAYSGVWPTGLRYDFPGQLALPASLVISLIYAIAVLRSLRYSEVALMAGAIAGAGRRN